MERARRSIEIAPPAEPQCEAQDNSGPPAPKCSMRIHLQQEQLTSKPCDSEQLPSSSNILPKKCLICKRYDPIYNM